MSCTKRFSGSYIPNEILGIIPMLGPLHISLNSREILIMKYWPFFDKLWKAVMG